MKGLLNGMAAAIGAGAWVGVLSLIRGASGPAHLPSDAVSTLGRDAMIAAVFFLGVLLADLVARTSLRTSKRRARLVLLLVMTTAVIGVGWFGDQLRHPTAFGATAFALWAAAGVALLTLELPVRKGTRGAMVLSLLFIAAGTTLTWVDPRGLRGTYLSLDLFLHGAALGLTGSGLAMLRFRGRAGVVLLVASSVMLAAPWVAKPDPARDALLRANSGRLRALDETLTALGLWPARTVDDRIVSIDPQALLAFPGDRGKLRSQYAAARDDDPPLNLLLITIDALRADATGLVGDTSHTQRLDALAREGVGFRRAWSQAPATAGSMESFLTGRYPSHTPVASALRTGEVTREAEGLPSIARSAGFETAWFSGLTTKTLHPVVWERLQRGFDLVVPTRGDPDAAAQVERGIAWMNEHKADRWFMWMHLFDPHEPYVARDDRTNDDARSRYESEVRYADRALGKLLDALKAAELDEQTVVIVHADHGEAFNEHGRYYHGTSFFQTQIHVPLVIRAPGIPPATSTRPVGNVDLASTVVDLLGLPVQPTHQGHSLLPTLLGQGSTWPRFALAETLVVSKEVPWSQSKTRTITDGRLKLIDHIDTGARLLFDLDVDPDEQVNLAFKRADDVRRLRGWLAALDQRFEEPAATTPSMSSSAVERLRARLTSGSPRTREMAFLELRNDPSVLAEVEDSLGSFDPGLAHTALNLIEQFVAADLEGEGTVVPLGEAPSATRYRLLLRYACSPRFWSLALPDLPTNASASERRAHQLARVARGGSNSAWSERGPLPRSGWADIAPALARGGRTFPSLLSLQLPTFEQRPDLLLRVLRALADKDKNEFLAFVLHLFPQPQQTMHARTVERLFSFGLEEREMWLARIALHAHVGPAAQRSIHDGFEKTRSGLGAVAVEASRIWSKARFEEPNNVASLTSLVRLLEQFPDDHDMTSVREELARARAIASGASGSGLRLLEVTGLDSGDGTIRRGPPTLRFRNDGNTPAAVGPGALASSNIDWVHGDGSVTVAASVVFPRQLLQPGDEVTIPAPMDYPMRDARLRVGEEILKEANWKRPAPPWRGPLIASVGRATLPLVPLDDATLFEVHSGGDALRLPGSKRTGATTVQVTLTAWSDDGDPVGIALASGGKTAPLGTAKSGVPATLRAEISIPADQSIALRILRGPALVEIREISFR